MTGTKTAKPFVKWAGGKGQLLDEIRCRYPIGLGKSINRYCEPFVGGGAVLFDILSNYNMKEVLINDVNAELINTYRQIQDNVFDLIGQLKSIQDTYWPLNSEKRRVYFYDMRKQFNDLKIDAEEQFDLEMAALFIFLNKTCFNGLYRVNKKGCFNVPMGGYKKPMICDENNLLAINELLKGVIIQCGDYKECEEFIDADTFVYIDPPYLPLTKTASFTAYTETRFDNTEQIALGEFVDSLHHKGAKVVVSNSDPKNIDDDDIFFDELYKEYNIDRVTAKRVINCNSGSRGEINELLITNF